MSAFGAGVVRAGSAAAAAATLHTAYNLTRLRRPPDTAPPPAPGERVSVLLPLRDEAHRVRPCLQSLRAALDRCGEAAEVVVLDDCSTDGTAAVVRRTAGGDARVRLVTGRPLPAGWLGKPWACQQLADAADPAATVLVFVDADVLLAPEGVAATVALLRSSGLDLVCPYPRQLADGPGPRLVQPLLQWSWLTFLPLGVAERSARPSLAAANGQLLAVDAAAYRRAGGHRAVRDAVLDDIALLRGVKRSGGRGAVADGTGLATCRMYDDWAALRDGYAKSLWAAFGSRPGAAGVLGLLTLLYVVPPVAALRGSGVGAAGYTVAVAGRALVARRVGGRVWPDSLAHPASVLALGWLTARSMRGHRRGSLQWKGRPVTPRGGQGAAAEVSAG